MGTHLVSLVFPVYEWSMEVWTDALLNYYFLLRTICEVMGRDIDHIWDVHIFLEVKPNKANIAGPCQPI